MLLGSYKSQYFFGALKGKWGFTKPTAKKNGFPAAFNCLRSSIDLFAVFPSLYASSLTSIFSYGYPCFPFSSRPIFSSEI